MFRTNHQTPDTPVFPSDFNLHWHMKKMTNIIQHHPTNYYLVGGMYTYPSEKYMSSLVGMMKFPIYIILY